MRIKTISAEDRRFKLEAGAGSDAVHSNPVYSFAVTHLTLDAGVTGTGIVLTMGRGNELVCGAIQLDAALAARSRASGLLSIICQ
jgi:L-fuconate dehydratase